MDTISGISYHRASDSPEPLGSMMKFLSSYFHINKENLICKENFFSGQSKNIIKKIMNLLHF